MIPGGAIFMQLKLKTDDVEKLNNASGVVLPKYYSQLINWANQNAQATRPKAVGQMSVLFPEYMANAEEVSPEGWKAYYTSQYPDSVDMTTERIYAAIEKLRHAINEMTKDDVRAWVEDLLFSKTYNGMYVQKAILSSLAKAKRLPYRLATVEEEAVGIDGYVGDTPYSVKPVSYRMMGRLSEEIDVHMIYYEKTKSGFTIEVEDDENTDQ